LIGKKVGNYVVVSLLGEGAQGVVYLAEHPEIGRKAALKVLKSEAARDRHTYSRFVAEARAASAIKHPNIIDIYDFGRLEDGQPYILLEKLDGESLTARLASSQRLSLDDALDFITQAGSALTAAHECGVLHRDLKPDNLFLIPDARSPGHLLVKVLDFGIAKLRGEGRPSMQTQAGSLMGTPLYMSPEQCRGSSQIDHRTDIYSLGIILYEMLCGAPPFVSDALFEVLNMHINQPPEPPRLRVPSIPESIDRAILRTLAKDPADRYASVAELMCALEFVQGAIVADVSAALGRPGVRPWATGRTPAPVAISLEPVKADPIDVGWSLTGAARAKRAVAARTAADARGIRPADSAANTLSARMRSNTLNSPPRSSALLIAIMGIGLVGTGAAFYFLRAKLPFVAGLATTPASAPAAGRLPEAASPGMPAAQGRITIAVDSTPPGASVVQVTTGDVLGKTPLTLTRTQSAGGSVRLRLDMAGYRSAVITVPLDYDVIAKEVLLALPDHKTGTSKRPARPAPVAAKPAARSAPERAGLDNL
jgi:serine/threonine-protein kinase